MLSNLSKKIQHSPYKTHPAHPRKTRPVLHFYLLCLVIYTVHNKGGAFLPFDIGIFNYTMQQKSSCLLTSQLRKQRSLWSSQPLCPAHTSNWAVLLVVSAVPSPGCQTLWRGPGHQSAQDCHHPWSTGSTFASACLVCPGGLVSHIRSSETYQS